MTKVKKGTWIDTSTGIVECPECGRRIGTKAQSAYLPSGKPRERYQKTITCVGCGSKFRLR